MHHGDHLGYRPLHWACENGHEAVAGCLLAPGAHIDQVDKLGWTALLIACVKGHLPVVLLSLLLEEGANPTVPNNGGWSPLMKWHLSTAYSSIPTSWQRWTIEPWRDERLSASLPCGS